MADPTGADLKKLSPEHQELFAILQQMREEFDDARLNGRTRQRGKYELVANQLIASGKALIVLSGVQFPGTRSSVQQGFDRVFKGTARKPGIRPDSDYRVMEYQGELVLLDFNHADAWEEWEHYLIRRTLPNAKDIAPIAREMDAIAKATLPNPA